MKTRTNSLTHTAQVAAVCMVLLGAPLLVHAAPPGYNNKNKPGDPNIEINLLEPVAVTISPQSFFELGSKATITCKWKKLGTKLVDPNTIKGFGAFDGNYAIKGNIILDGIAIQKFYVHPAGSMAKTEGSESVEWFAKPPIGKHTGSCVIDPDNLVHKQVYPFVLEVREVKPVGYNDTLKAIGSPMLPRKKGLPPKNGPLKSVPPSMPAGLPDLVIEKSLTVGGVPGSWGGSINISDDKAYTMGSGKCQFSIEYDVRNQGFSGTGPVTHTALWTNSATPNSDYHDLLPIDPGKVLHGKEMLTLKPGSNLVQLKLDVINKVQEMNETNNSSRVIVNLSGKCGAQTGDMATPAPGPAIGRPSPRLPARSSQR